MAHELTRYEDGDGWVLGRIREGGFWKLLINCCCPEDEEPPEPPPTDPNGDPVPPPRTGAADCCRCELSPAEPCEVHAHTASQCRIQGAVSNPDMACADVGGGLVGKVTSGTVNHAFACDMPAKPNLLTICSCGGGYYLIDPGGVLVSYYTDGLCEAEVDHTEHELEVQWEINRFFGDLVVQVVAASGGQGAWFGELEVPGSANCKGPHAVPFVNPLDPAPPQTWFMDGSALVEQCEPLDANESSPGLGDGCVDFGDDFAMGFGALVE